MTYALPTDVGLRWQEGSVTSDNEAHIGILLADAEAKLKSRVPGLAERVASGAIPEDTVVMVECAIVLRVLRSPGVYSQQIAGPFSGTVNLSIASGVLEVTGEDLADLGIRSRSRAFTLNTDPVWGG